MAAVGPSELLILVALFFSGGFGLPVGVPPEKADPMLARVAPEDCLFYGAWAGSVAPDPASPNHTEQLLAEPEVKQFVSAVTEQLHAVLERAGSGRDPKAQLLADVGPQLLTTLLSRPAAVFVRDVSVRPDGSQIDAGLLVNAGEDVDEVRKALERLQNELAPDRVEDVEIAGIEFHRLVARPKAPPVTWGVRGKYLIAGVGEGSVERILERVRKEPPKWLAELGERAHINRVASVTYLDLGKVRDKLLPLAPDPRIGQALDSLGLTCLSKCAAVSGLDATGYVSRTWVDVDGAPRGLLKLMDAKPLAAEDLAPIPQDALVALAFRLNLGQVLDLGLEAAKEIEPDAAEEMLQGLGQMEEGLGFRIRDGLLKALGDVWTLSTSPSDGGLVTGWTATVQVRDREQLLDIHNRLVAMARREAGDHERAPQIRQLEFAGHTIHYLVVPDDDFPLTPAWCLTDKQLVVSLFPQAVKGYLSRGEGYQSLAENKAVAGLIQGDAGPIAVVYADSQQIFRTFYPIVQILGQVGLQQARRAGVNLDPILLPSGSAIEKHLQPLVIIKRRTETGIEVVSHQTLPGLNVGATVPVAAGLLLPAIQSAREAARRSQAANNLKQIALAMHNYHDTFRGFPASYSADKDGKPLLSWRVHVLPYIEQQALYEQFHLDEPWDSEHNQSLIERMPPVYRSPNSNAAPGKTNYLGVRGKEKVFVAPKQDFQGKWPLGTGMQEILDGTSNTIMVVEVNDETAVTWTKPDDFEPDEENPLKGLLGLRPGGFQAGLCDGSVRFFAGSIDPKVLKAMFTKAGGEVVPFP
jgi:hypothetical protein